MTVVEKLLVSSESWQRAASLYVRFKVFVLERDIDLKDEFDHLDNDGRVYAVVYLDKTPVATGRFIKEDDELARLTRIAILSEYRGKGYGAQIISELEAHAKSVGVTRLQIHAELTAKTFYEKLGYYTVSDVYIEDGEPCQTLEKLI